MLTLGPCDEVLPPYIEPEKIMSGEMTGLYHYFVTPTVYENWLVVFFAVTNTYDETLDDTVNFHGTIVVQSQRVPHIKRTFSIGPSQLESGSQYYNGITKRLTLDPGKSIVFSVIWDLSLDDRMVDPRGEMFTFFCEPGCPVFYRAAPEDLVLTGELYVFEERAPVRADVVFPICYVEGYWCPESYLSDPPCVAPPSPLWPRCYPFGATE